MGLFEALDIYKNRPNTELLRVCVTKDTTAYLDNLGITSNHVKVVCDETNNSPDDCYRDTINISFRPLTDYGKLLLKKHLGVE